MHVLPLLPQGPHDPRTTGRRPWAPHRKSSYVSDNPPGAAFTDMKVFEVHFWEAYTLDESFSS